MITLDEDEYFGKGNKGAEVKEIQELLCLYGFFTKIDSDYGPATQKAVAMFQQTRNINITTDMYGSVDKLTLEFLYHKINKAKNAITDPRIAKFKNTKTLPRTVLLRLARYHLALKPMEVGGENMGPWVRFYTHGLEGKAYPWCAGFVSVLYSQMVNVLGLYGQNRPLFYTLSCDELANTAKQSNILYNSKIQQPLPGHIFLILKKNNDWIHTGIVEEVWKDCFSTIEGNTNDEGSTEGYKVCRRYRSYTNMDFIEV